MANISLSYPESGLTISINVYNRDTNSLDFTGTCTENLTTATYDYDFTEAPATDYIYVANATGYEPLTGVLFRDITTGGGGGGASVADIWGAQISDYSDTVGSFANKFSNYGGVSHIIEKVSSGGLNEEEKIQVMELVDKIKEVKEKLVEMEKNGISKETIKEVVRVEKVFVPTMDSTGIVDAIIEGISEVNDTLTDTFIEAVGELKNK